jgi:hypothetical protein
VRAKNREDCLTRSRARQAGATPAASRGQPNPARDSVKSSIDRFQTIEREQTTNACRSIPWCVLAALRCAHFIAVSRAKRQNPPRVKYWEIIADKLSKAGWSWGCVSAVDSDGRTIFVADAHRNDGKRFVVRADEKLTAFLQLESVIRHCSTRAFQSRCQHHRKRGSRHCVSGCDVWRSQQRCWPHLARHTTAARMAARRKLVRRIDTRHISRAAARSMAASRARRTCS